MMITRVLFENHGNPRKEQKARRAQCRKPLIKFITTQNLRFVVNVARRKVYKKTLIILMGSHIPILGKQRVLNGGCLMSEKDVTKFLQILGLSKREIQVYMFLAKSGVQSTSFVAKRLKMERVQAYRTFKKLQEKGFIEATLERPTRFTIVPFEALVDSFITAKKNEVTNLNDQKQTLLTAWQSISAPESEYPVAKFSIITGKKKIHSKMLSMIEESNHEVIILTTALGLIQEDIAGVFDAAISASQDRNIQLQVITDISPENLQNSGKNRSNHHRRQT